MHLITEQGYYFCIFVVFKILKTFYNNQLVFVNKYKKENSFLVMQQLTLILSELVLFLLYYHF